MVVICFPSASLTGREQERTAGLDEAKTIWHELLGNISDSYRPELHYMRGPGPKWRAKHRHEFGLIEFCGPGGHRYREHPAADRTAPVH
jgi:hypothetical protein